MCKSAGGRGALYPPFGGGRLLVGKGEAKYFASLFLRVVFDNVAERGVNISPSSHGQR